MAAKIKLKRLGKIRNPQYRIIVADARAKRDGRAIEELGIYQPKEEPTLIRVNSERVQYWLGVGAQPTPPVLVILKITGDWQRHKGLPGAEGTLRTAEAKPSREDRFAAALAAAHSSAATAPAPTARRARPSGDSGNETPGDSGNETPGDTSESTQGEAVDPNPTESAKVEAVAQDPTAGGDELPEAAVAADSAPTSDIPQSS